MPQILPVRFLGLVAGGLCSAFLLRACCFSDENEKPITETEDDIEEKKIQKGGRSVGKKAQGKEKGSRALERGRHYDAERCEDEGKGSDHFGNSRIDFGTMIAGGEGEPMRTKILYSSEAAADADQPGGHFSEPPPLDTSSGPSTGKIAQGFTGVKRRTSGTEDSRETPELVPNDTAHKGDNPALESNSNGTVATDGDVTESFRAEANGDRCYSTQTLLTKENAAHSRPAQNADQGQKAYIYHAVCGTEEEGVKRNCEILRELGRKMGSGDDADLSEVLIPEKQACGLLSESKRGRPREATTSQDSASEEKHSVQKQASWLGRLWSSSVNTPESEGSQGRDQNSGGVHTITEDAEWETISGHSLDLAPVDLMASMIVVENEARNSAETETETEKETATGIWASMVVVGPPGCLESPRSVPAEREMAEVGLRTEMGLAAEGRGFGGKGFGCESEAVPDGGESVLPVSQLPRFEGPILTDPPGSAAGETASILC